MFDYPILSLLIWVPILIGLLLILSKNISDNLSQLITLLTSFLILVVSINLTQAYDHTTSRLQFIERIEWISDLDIFYYLAVDGISVSLILLTAFINFLIAIYASSENYAKKSSFLGYFLIELQLEELCEIRAFDTASTFSHIYTLNLLSNPSNIL